MQFDTPVRSQSGKRLERTDTGPVRTGQEDTLREGAVEDGSTHRGERTRDSHKGHAWHATQTPRENARPDTPPRTHTRPRVMRMDLTTTRACTTHPSHVPPDLPCVRARGATQAVKLARTYAPGGDSSRGPRRPRRAHHQLSSSSMLASSRAAPASLRRGSGCLAACGGLSKSAPRPQ